MRYSAQRLRALGARCLEGGSTLRVQPPHRRDDRRRRLHVRVRRSVGVELARVSVKEHHAAAAAGEEGPLAARAGLPQHADAVVPIEAAPAVLPLRERRGANRRKAGATLQSLAAHPTSRSSQGRQTVKHALVLCSAVLACCIVISSSAQHSAPGDIIPVGQDLTGSGCPRFPLNSLGKQGGAGYAVGVRRKSNGRF
jgi:hypothetical protein